MAGTTVKSLTSACSPIPIKWANKSDQVWKKHSGYTVTETAGVLLCLKKQPLALRVIKACTRVGIRLENELILYNALKSFA